MGEWVNLSGDSLGSPSIEGVDRVATREDKAQRSNVACGFRTVSQERLLSGVKGGGGSEVGALRSAMCLPSRCCRSQPCALLILLSPLKPLLTLLTAPP